MASNNINVGSAANDGEGQTLRAAMISVRKNFAQMFGITYTSDTQDLSGTTFSSDVIIQGSTNKFLTNGSVIAARLASNAVTTIKILDANITTAKILDANVTTAKILDANVTTAKIANDAVSHDKLENRFIPKVSVSGRSGATSIDWSAGAVFVMANSLNGNIEFDFTNFKTGQTIDIYNLTGAHTITFDSDASTSETFNKCGGVDYAGASTNLIQVQCVDDSAAAVFNYAVSAYVSDTTPS